MGIPLPISDLMICPRNCSGNGDCLGGTCLCQVFFSGNSCSDPNFSYYLSFGVIFYIVCFMAIIQLILCIRSDFLKMNNPSILKACKFNIQKLTYVSIICATGSRAVYFVLGLQDLIPKSWKEDLYPLYYAFVLSGFSLIICFWAESFHLTGLQFDRSRFLTKSYHGFLAFNVLVYFLLLTQVTSNHVLTAPLLTKVTETIHGCLAFLMFFTLIFFLIYGVEIFCKVEGAFRPSLISNEKHINLHQLFQSRLGLLAQAAFQLAVTMFLTGEVLGEMWKRNMSIGDRNIIHIAFHVAELACALWFPCCLWNVSKPGDLWILNPKNLLLGRFNEHDSFVRTTPPPSNYNTFESPPQNAGLLEEKDVIVDDSSVCDAPGDCWICYDSENMSAMIRPCDCKGGLALVHHDCLKRWILESLGNGGGKENITCGVCKATYHISSDQSAVWVPNGMQMKAWSQTFVVVLTMISVLVALVFAWKKIRRVYIRIVVVAFFLIAEYTLLRLLGFNFLKAYKITKSRALKILGRNEKPHASSISSTTEVSVAS